MSSIIDSDETKNDVTEIISDALPLIKELACGVIDVAKIESFISKTHIPSGVVEQVIESIKSRKVTDLKSALEVVPIELEKFADSTAFEQDA